VNKYAAKRIQVLIANNEAASPAPAAPDAAAPAPVIDPASVVVTDRAGTVLVPAGNAAPANAAVPVAQNASNALATVPDVRLTSYAVGYPTDELERVQQFIAPMVPAPLKFSYLVRSKANAYGTVADDVVGVNGLPALVQPDAASVVERTLQFRGLETQMSDQEVVAFNATPGWSGDMEWQDRIGELMDWVRRGRFQRTMAAAVATTGGATSKTWNAAANPISDLRAEIKTIAKLAGGKQNVRLLFGCDAWEIMVDQAKLAGGTSYPYQVVDEAVIARLLGIPAANITVTYLQVVSSAQGVTTTTSTDLLTAAELWIFAASSNPNRRDPSFIKTFFMQYNGAPYYVYQFKPHPLFERRGLAYYDYISVTNSAAVKRLTIASS